MRIMEEMWPPRPLDRFVVEGEMAMSARSRRMNLIVRRDGCETGLARLQSIDG